MLRSTVVGTTTLPQVLGTVEEALPIQSVVLREPAVQVTVVLIGRLRQIDPDDESGRANLARLFTNLSNRQSEMGLRSEALASITEAGAIRRSLAAANPDAFRPDFAMSLTSLSNRQSAMGLRSEALASITEAVAIRRSLLSAF